MRRRPSVSTWRALVISENSLGPDHPGVAAVLENYAVLLCATNRDGEAAEMEARAAAIRRRHAEREGEAGGE